MPVLPLYPVLQNILMVVGIFFLSYLKHNYNHHYKPYIYSKRDILRGIKYVLIESVLDKTKKIIDNMGVFIQMHEISRTEVICIHTN